MPLYGIPPFFVFGAGEIRRNRNARIQSQTHLPPVSARQEWRDFLSYLVAPKLKPFD
jgi:hypothetical protein